MPIHANVIHCKQIIGKKCERTAKSMATPLKFPLTYSMKLVKTIFYKINFFSNFGKILLMFFHNSFGLFIIKKIT